MSPPPRPDSGLGFVDRPSRPRTKLSLTTFRRQSPAPTQVPSFTSTLTQDGSYLEALNLKLGEAVSKALAQPIGGQTNVSEVVGGRRPLPAGRGQALGLLIASEYRATKDNPPLRRALFRCLQKPMSVLMTNLSSDLLPLLSSSAFLAPHAPTVQAPNPNPTQSNALSLAAFAGELLEVFDELGFGLENDVRGDGLKVTREGLVSVVDRVVKPLIGGIKNELVTLVDALEDPSPSTITGAKGGAKIHSHHASIVALQNTIPIYARALARYTPSAFAQNTYLAPLLISVIWRGLVALSSRPADTPSPPTSPIPSAHIPKKSRGSSTTPPATPPSARFTIKLPLSRPPSPPTAVPPSSAATDARALFELLNVLPRPDSDKETTRFARGAVDEAFDALSALSSLLESIRANKGRRSAKELEDDIDVLATDLPTLIALSVLLKAYAPSEERRSVASFLALSEDEYRKGCLSGFRSAMECAPFVGKRVLDVLDADIAQTGSSDELPTDVEVVATWLEKRLNMGNAGAED